MAPLADAALFVALVAVVMPLVLVLPIRHVERMAIFMFGFVLAASLLLLHGEISNVATVMLSAGIAVQVMKSGGLRVERLDPLVRRTLPWMVATCLGTAIVLPISWNWLESRAIQRLSSVSGRTPNILILVWDTVRSQDLSTYGYDRDTSPNLTALAKGGIVFERAIAPSSWTLPSHASLFTGRWAHELSTISGAPLDSENPTLPEVLSDNGYATAAFVANQYVCNRDSGLGRGFLRFDDFSALSTEFVLSCQVGRRLTTSPLLRRWTAWQDFWGRKSAERVNADFLEWLDRRPHRPFFAFLNFYDAHQPYFAPDLYYRQFGPPKPQEDRSVVAGIRHADVVELHANSPSQQSEQQQRYDASIAYLDACLGRLIDALQTRGILENTLVILTSDHGEHFGEHGLQGHGNSLYRPLLHVPLVIRLPGDVPMGLRLQEPVSLRDVPATVVDLAGCRRGCQLPGNSLANLWHKTRIRTCDAVLASVGTAAPDGTANRMDAVIAAGLHYIRYGDGREELFDFFKDPAESDDLIKSDNVREPLSRIRAMAEKQLTEPLNEESRDRPIRFARRRGLPYHPRPVP
ncbi:MAG: sulfatase [Rhodopirellula sp.]|nr:sulfatase [Rhodopirellula sp.]